MTSSSQSPTLGEILAAEIERQGITRHAVAERAGLPRQSVYSAISGTSPTLGTLRAILRALGRPWAWLDEQGFAP